LDEPDGARVCLATYHAAGIGEPPEVEAGHFDWLYEERAGALGQDPKDYRSRYWARQLPSEELAWLDQFFLHDRSMRESGHDTTYRWTTEKGDRCANFATIDLNALLFKIELDVATLSKALGRADWVSWCGRAQARRALVQKHLWNGELFVDFELERDTAGQLLPQGKQSERVSATTLYALWASGSSVCVDARGQPLALLDHDQARVLVQSALGALEEPGGLAATSPVLDFRPPVWPERQWDHPFGWAPHQILAWTGLRQWGFHDEATRLTYRWLFMMVKNAHDYHGTVPEKYDVVRRSHEVFAEYGNVGTEFSYITEEGFGWMNAAFQLGWASLSPARRDDLRHLVDPAAD
jgi:alpha,alpha-trehalase